MELKSTSRATLWQRSCQFVVGTIIVVALTAIATELIARNIFDLSPLAYTRPPHPLLFTGDQVPPTKLSELYTAPGGPVSLGYSPNGLAFSVDADAPSPGSMTTLSDFLFEHKLSRYTADDVDRLLCNDANASALYVIGSSGAQGFAATSKLLAWHALLEEDLRKKLGKSNLYVFDAALGGYGAFQDKLTYHLAVAPRVPGAILFYNSGNDLQVISGNRPGDPAFLGTWYGTVYGNRLLFWLAEHSAVVNSILQKRFADEFNDFLARLERDDAFFERHTSAALNLYLESMSEILSVCEAQGRPCWVAIQPNRAFTSARTGGNTPDVLSARRMRQIYDMLMQRLAGNRYRDRFIDLTGIFDEGERERYFTDTVHVTDSGQPLIAKALSGRIAPSLAVPLPRGRTVDRCAALPEPQLLATVPLDRAWAEGDGRVSYSNGLLSVHAGPSQWAYIANVPIDLDPVWSAQNLIVRVRFTVTKGDMAVSVVDQATWKEIASDRPFKAGDGEVTAYLSLRGHPRRISVIFKKTLPDGVASDVVVREISVLAK